MTLPAVCSAGAGVKPVIGPMMVEGVPVEVGTVLDEGVALAPGVLVTVAVELGPGVLIPLTGAGEAACVPVALTLAWAGIGVARDGRTLQAEITAAARRRRLARAIWRSMGNLFEYGD